MNIVYNIANFISWFGGLCFGLVVIGFAGSVAFDVFQGIFMDEEEDHYEGD